MLQTFPNYGEAVTITPAELNDAALKSVAQSIDGPWTFTELINGTASGNLVPGDIPDLAPYTQAAVDEVITGIWIHNAPLKLDTNVALFSESQGTDHDLIKLNLAGNYEFGNYALNGEIHGANDVNIRMGSGGDDIAVGSFRSLENGGIEVRDLASSRRKVGFRNPKQISVNTQRAFIQSDEGGFLVKGTSNVGTYFVDPLEDATTLTFLNASGSVQTLQGRNGILLSAYIGGEVIQGDLLIEEWSIVQLYWSSPTVCYVWGNGISAG